MPFADDVNLSQLPGARGQLRLVIVSTNPQHFRFNHLGDELIHRLGANVTSKFADEVELSRSLRIFHRASERHGRSAVADLLLQPARVRASCASDLGRRPHRVATRRNRVVASKAEGRFAASRGSIRRVSGIGRT